MLFIRSTILFLALWVLFYGELKASAYTTQINELISQSDSIYTLDRSKGLQSLNRAIRMAQESGFEKGLAKAFYKLVDHYWDELQYDSVLVLGSRLLEKVRNAKDKPMLADAYYMLGNAYVNSSQIDRGIDHYQQAITLYKELDPVDFWDVCWATRMIAFAYRLKSAYYQSLEYAQKALILAKDLEDERLISQVLNDIGVIYMENEEFEAADSFFHLVLEAVEAIRPYETENMAWNNLGRNMYLSGDYEKAIPYLKKGLELERDSKCNYMYPSYNLGHVFLYQNQYDSAYYYLNKALQGGTICNSSYIRSLGLVDLGLLYIERGQNFKAVQALEEAVDLAQNAGMRKEALVAAEKLYHINKKFQNHSKALYYLELAMENHDSVFNQENDKKIARLEADFAFQNEKQALEKANEEAMIALNEKLRRQQFLQIISGIGLIISITFLFFLYRHDRLKRQANEELSRLNDELRDRSEQILKTRDQLIMREKMAWLGLLAAGIADEIKSPIKLVVIFAQKSMQLIRDFNSKLLSYTHHIKPDPKETKEEIKYLVKDLEQNALDIQANGLRVSSIANGLTRHAQSGKAGIQRLNLVELINKQVSLAYHRWDDQLSGN